MQPTTLLNSQKTIGIITILSGIAAAGSLAASIVGVHNHTEALSNPLLVLTLKDIDTSALRWSMILDMLGYYLLLLPIIFLLHDWLKKQTAWAKAISFSGVAYVLIGAIGAAILATVWPQVLDAYFTAVPAEQVILKSNFQVFNAMVYGGMWNLLEVFFAAVWWTFTGIVFFQNRFRFIGILTIVLGLSCFGDGFGTMFSWQALGEISLNLYLVLAIVWAFCIGGFLLRKRLLLTSKQEIATASINKTRPQLQD